MFKKMALSLLMLSCTVVYAQQKKKASDIIGTWQVSAIVSDGKTIPVDSEKALWDFMSGQMMAGKDSTDTDIDIALTSEDSAGIRAAVTVLGMFSKSTVVFKPNKTFVFSLVMGGQKNDKNGTWLLNEATQIIRITETTKAKTAKSEIIKILIKGDQLLIQMEKDKEEGFLVSRQK